ncbi:MAG: hypothetical protein ACPG31_12525 [Planctomycetota bacterium]
MALSREWVCVRLASYEDVEEAAYLTELYRGRTGQLNNTTFALIAPDGKTLLDRSGRGPSFLIDMPHNPDVPATMEQTRAFALKMDQFMLSFEPKAELASLPQAIDFRRSLNIAACDNQPLVVACAKSEKKRKALESQLAELAWSDAFIGRLQYVIVADRNELDSIGPIPEGDFLAVIQPGQFGTDGTILRQIGAKASDSELQKLLRVGLESYTREGLSRKEHFKQGTRKEAYWETVVPVTDEGKGGRSR